MFGQKTKRVKELENELAEAKEKFIVMQNHYIPANKQMYDKVQELKKQNENLNNVLKKAYIRNEKGQIVKYQK